jgi:hypothetical protein
VDYINHDRLGRAFHPPFSPNLAFSDYDLFDKVEPARMGRIFNDENELVHCVMDVLNGITGGELEAVFEKCLVPFDACMEQDGDSAE